MIASIGAVSATPVSRAEAQTYSREQFERGYQAQMAGRFEEAVECYQRSLAIHPSAEDAAAMARHGCCASRYFSSAGACRRRC